MQKPSSLKTRYRIVKQPTVKDGYAQRIPIWQAVKKLGSANRSELLRELEKMGYARPNGASVDEAYCRIELTDMTKRGFFERIED